VQGGGGKIFVQIKKNREEFKGGLQNTFMKLK